MKVKVYQQKSNRDHLLTAKTVVEANCIRSLQKGDSLRRSGKTYRVLEKVLDLDSKEFIVVVGDMTYI